ncbi:hypothetical protein FraQA3DRAFT_3372 [Frankia sp. QA3]|nr:hypothetical protein FraQA3DRAFT_3372 [Frankia sp. QA3]
MKRSVPVQADFLYLRCPEHRGRQPRQGLKTMLRPGAECPRCRLVRAPEPPPDPGQRPGKPGHPTDGGPTPAT